MGKARKMLFFEHEGNSNGKASKGSNSMQVSGGRTGGSRGKDEGNLGQNIEI